MAPSIHTGLHLICVSAAITFAGLGSGCAKSVSREGEIFLVAASGDSQKLGLVEVFTVSPDVAPGDTITAISRQQQLVNAAEQQLALAKSALKRFGAEMRHRSNAMHASVKGARGLSEQTSRLREMLDQSKADISTVKQLSDAEVAASAVRDQALQGLLDLWSSVVASPRAATKSDSGGAFSISCRSNDLICAYTTRAVSEGTQHLIWIVAVHEMPPAGKLLLSNDNLVAIPGD